MKILVTGGAGFIGSHIVDHLIMNKYEVAVLDNLITGKEENINPSSAFYRVDISDYKSLEKVFKIENPHCVIHHAAQTNVQQSIVNPIFDAETNILGTINLLRCCVKFETEKIVYASSAAVYGNPIYLGITEEHTIEPLSFYGSSKQTPEQYIKIYSDLYNLDYTILRYANAYGIRQDPKGEGGVVSIFLDKLLDQKQPVIFGDGTQTRDFIYVEDIALANMAAIHLGSRQIVNISTNQPTSLLTLLDMMNEICGTKISPIFMDAKQGDIKTSYLNNRKASQFLSWEPLYSLCQGLRFTAEYYRHLYSTQVAFS
ncbi:MAG: NAD-dependent epimerase/dehydratase family protein [Desulfosporosinus sp.]|nr:NAD-dependent epimerase/dehydratase family protein [Desulfosporosinus sp.]